MALPYPGNIPSNVNKDAKYSVMSGADGYVVKLIYRISHREKALLTTNAHSDLVEMVNAVKVEKAGTQGGAFYINEYCDVLVPVAGGGGSECFFAGTYQSILEFDFEGQIIGPCAPAGLRPGEPWPGPHVGIRYKLTAGGNDIAYERPSGPNRVITERLSDHHDSDEAAALARRLAKVKGDQGGRIYINEAGEFFSPPSSRSDEYLYLGPLDEDVWFPPPPVPRP